MGIPVNILDTGKLLFAAILAARLQIIFNPPFRGSKERDASQNLDMEAVFVGEKKWGKCDYCVSWYKKAADYSYGTEIRCALVSTNSICQGEQVQATWERLFSKGIRINFAYLLFVKFCEGRIATIKEGENRGCQVA